CEDLSRTGPTDTNPGSTVKLGVTNIDDKTYFDRFYVCFGGLKEGFKNGCRRVVALDGCFLKSPNQGADLDMPSGHGLTLMSDQHKGLIEAVKQVMTDAEHKQCARHIYENFRKQYSGLELRQLFWAASKASYPQLFNKIMEQIKAENPGAYQYLIDKDPKT
ncbi:multidrug resistance-associated protein 5, partial [Tanacetum coccineum]